MDIDAVEEAFILGDWARVLQQSREKLLARVAASEGPQDEAVMQAQEALVSMYLQSVFELSAQDEIETAFALVQSLSPLPFNVSLQWIKFLIAMDRRSDALESLNELLQLCSTKLDGPSSQDDWSPRYVQATEVLVFLVLLPSESSSVVRNYITADRVLDEATKQRLLEAVSAKEATASAALAAKESKSTTSPPFSANPSSNGSAQTHEPKHKNLMPAPGVDSTDPAADLVAIGGTVIAVAAVAIGVYSYRDRLRDAVAEIGPAVSKGLADAKYALFES